MMTKRAAKASAPVAGNGAGNKKRKIPRKNNSEVIPDGPTPYRRITRSISSTPVNVEEHPSEEKPVYTIFKRAKLNKSRGVVIENGCSSLRLPPKLMDVEEIPDTGKINSYSRTCHLVTINQVLNGYSEMEQLMVSQFSGIFDIPAKKAALSGRLLHNMLSRTLLTRKRHEMWFLFANQPVRFSLREFALITGLNCSPYPSDTELENLRIQSKSRDSYWFELFGDELAGGLIQDIVDFLVKDMDEDTDNKIDSVRRFRLCLVVLIDGVLCCKNSSAVRASPMTVELVRDIPSFLAFPWGRHSFEQTIEMVRVGSHSNQSVENMLLKLNEQTHFAMKGFTVAFQLLFFSTIPAFNRFLPAKGLDTILADPSLTELEQCREFTNKILSELDNDPRTKVLSILSWGRPLINKDFSWNDEVEDPSVEYMLQLIAAKSVFKRDDWVKGTIDLPPPPALSILARKERLPQRKASTTTMNQKVGAKGGKGRVKGVNALYGEDLGISSALIKIDKEMVDKINKFIQKVCVEHNEKVYNILIGKQAELKAVISDCESESDDPEDEEAGSNSSDPDRNIVLSDPKKNLPNTNGIKVGASTFVQDGPGEMLDTVLADINLSQGIPNEHVQGSRCVAAAVYKEDIVPVQSEVPSVNRGMQMVVVAQNPVGDISVGNGNHKELVGKVVHDCRLDQTDNQPPAKSISDDVTKEAKKVGKKGRIDNLQKLDGGKGRTTRSMRCAGPPDGLIDKFNQLGLGKIDNELENSFLSLLIDYDSDEYSLNEIAVPKSFFQEIYTPKFHVSTNHICLMVEAVWRRLESEAAKKGNLFLNSHFTSLLVTEHKRVSNANEGSTIVWNKTLQSIILGESKSREGNYKWFADVGRVYAPFHLSQQKHWVGLCIDLVGGTVTVFDSLINLTSTKRMTEAITPLLEVIPRLTNSVINSKETRIPLPAEYVLIRPTNVYQNLRTGDCGPLAVKMLEMHAENIPLDSITDEHVDNLRMSFALDIYERYVNKVV